MKELKMGIKFISLLLVSFFTLNCGSVKFPRTEQIPRKSKWIGGRDGGAWVYVEIDSLKEIKIEVYGAYYDKTSELLGVFKYENICLEKKVTEKKILTAILFSDGLNIEWNQNKSIIGCLKIK